MRLAPLALLLLAGCVVHRTKPPLEDGPALLTTAGAQGKPLDFSLRRYPDNSMFQLSSERGHVVLLDVWATWCEPCRETLPVYQDLAKQYGPRGFRVYAISVDGDEREIPKFIQETGLTLPVLLDPEARWSEPTLKVKMMPTAFLIDKKGVVRIVHEGVDEDLLQRYLLEIEGLLSEP